MKNILGKCSLAAVLLVLALSASSQSISSADKKKLRAIEDTLADYAYFLNTDSLTETRMVSDSVFTRTLVRALKIKNSFYLSL